MNPEIEIIETKGFDSVVADEIVASITDVTSCARDCSLVLAGGSTPSSIYRQLGNPPRVDEIPWDHMKLYWGDERWVPRDHSQSNYAMVQQTLLSHIRGGKPRIFAVDTSLKDPQAGAAAYSATILREEGQEPVFDLVLLGIGEDGHTASLFPSSATIGRSDAFCFATKQPETGDDRITISGHLLFSAARVIFTVKGTGKAAIMRRILQGNEDVSLLPARLYTQAKGKVSFLLDSGAARDLAK